MVSVNFDERRLSYVTVNRSTCAEIASVYAILITRAACEDGFPFMLDCESCETSDLAATLFDNDGKIRSDHVDHEFFKGTGVWGRELNDDKLVYVPNVIVKGEGGTGVQDWALVLQKFLESKAGDNLTSDSVTAFFRKNGFRRIGRTCYFGYSPNPNHASRSLAIQDDVEIKLAKATPGIVLDFERPEDLLATGRAVPHRDEADERHRQEYPLHHRFYSSVPEESVSSFVDFIQTTHGSTPELLRGRDDEKRTLLHIAAASFNIVADRPNGVGKTPLETCEHVLRSSGEFGEMFGWCRPRPEAGLRTAYVLRSAAGEDIGGLSEDEYVRVKAFGCTCNRCRDGWLSPRMVARMLVDIDTKVDKITHFLGTARMGNRPIPPTNIEELELNNIPNPLWQYITSQVSLDYIHLLATIRTILQHPNEVPSSKSVLERAGTIGSYLAVGGADSVLYAFDSITNRENHEEVLGEVAEEVYERDDVPECANDRKYGLVRSKLGIDQWRFRSGPYDQWTEEGRGYEAHRMLVDGFGPEYENDYEEADYDEEDGWGTESD
ncbi:hypothetical protein K474DRAFT_1711376 [Panus rudis PR-1116 ss-1]|nr:hypothetical protein K474DRAFT_1711376 [Panus rudis PR-1116 ss-1]